MLTSVFKSALSLDRYDLEKALCEKSVGNTAQKAAPCFRHTEKLFCPSTKSVSYSDECFFVL